MKRYLVVLFLLLPMALMAQNGTSSPFSRFAYGDLDDNVPATFRAMGGVGTGMRSSHVICPSQPASYTACDSLTFMMDVAASVGWSRYTDAAGTKNRANGNLDYLTLQFPIWKKHMAMSLGVLPYSAVGYSLLENDSTAGGEYHFTRSYEGEGGISQVYVGLSANLFDWVALGANVYYMFGDVNNYHTLTFTEPGLKNTSLWRYMTVSSVRLRYGLQFFHTFDEHAFVLGGTFENAMPLRSTYVMMETTEADSVYADVAGFEVPMQYSVGGSYSWKERLTLAFDYENQYLSRALYLGKTGMLHDRSRYSFGMEYRHNPMGRNYAERMIWRCGVKLATNYAYADTPDLTVSMGMGFPLRMSMTRFNVSVEYGHRGAYAGAGLQEHSLRLVLNAAVAENWFFKRRL